MKNLEFKHIAHLYVGCLMANQLNTNVAVTLNSVSSESPPTVRRKVGISSHSFYLVDGDNLKPLLRPITDICELECKALDWGNFPITEDKVYETLANISPVEFIHLLAMRFDLFKLIENGQAIDITLTKHSYDKQI